MTPEPRKRIARPVLSLVVLLAWGCGSPSTSDGPAPPANRDVGSSQRSVHGSDPVRLGEAVVERLGLEIAEAGPGDVETTVELPGEVRVNGDRMAHVSPRVAGVARSVLVSLGDTVSEGQLLAVLESRDLADAKADYLAARERVGLAEVTFRREERLWNERVSSEQDYLDARNAHAEARIALRTAEKKLHVLGFDDGDLEQLDDEPDTGYADYRVTAPFTGEVIDRHITIGETVAAETNVFTIADLSTVWVDLSVYPRDLARVSAGSLARVEPAGDGGEMAAPIEFVQPLLGEDTRTALARITMPNSDRRWKPGMFVTARVVVEARRVPVRVPGSAVIRMDDGHEVVFVQTESGFEPRPVSLGLRTDDHAEVTAGLEPGERYVAAGGFSLKAELGKHAFGDAHGH